MITMAHWIYFKVKRDVYINDCQDAWNNGMHPNSEVYHPVVVPGKFPIAGGSDKRHCINLIKQLVIGSGFTVFIGNFIQVRNSLLSQGAIIVFHSHTHPRAQKVVLCQLHWVIFHPSKLAAPTSTSSNARWRRASSSKTVTLASTIPLYSIENKMYFFCRSSK